jgi:hypothetical protein
LAITSSFTSNLEASRVCHVFTRSSRILLAFYASSSPHLQAVKFSIRWSCLPYYCFEVPNIRGLQQRSSPHLQATSAQSACHDFGHKLLITKRFRPGSSPYCQARGGSHFLASSPLTRSHLQPPSFSASLYQQRLACSCPDHVAAAGFVACTQGALGDKPSGTGGCVFANCAGLAYRSPGSPNRLGVSPSASGVGALSGSTHLHRSVAPELV